ncbi:hypothetical protein [Rheinheimera sp.]|uniref:hypothetical protein n=1 Tax=Rheinheimera sp. TaxID=1869214 RepID=UPI00263838E2|nr:hypothetical protein [Rheinheimera sp.]MCA1930194.1 hypothetical protein [Rheinheimera sp.]
MKILARILFVAIAIISVKLIASELEGQIYSIERGNDYTWELNKDISVSISINCPLRANDIFQKADSCNSAFNIYSEPYEVTIYVGKTSISSNRRFYNNSDDRRIIRSLAEQGEDPLLTLKYFKNSGDFLGGDAEYSSEKYRLIGFSTALQESKELGQAENQRKVTRHNIIAGVGIVLFILVLCLIIALFIKKILPRIRSTSSDVNQKFAKNREMAKIRKISKEEAIRHTVRSTISNEINMQPLTQEQIDVIKQQIKEALEKDDSKTALALMSILSGMQK